MLTQVAETQCGRVEYSEAGSGLPVLYFHGTGVTGDVMVTVEASMIDDGFRLIVPNRPGYGQTPRAAPRTAARCAKVAAALLDALGIERVGVMGSSGGAALALSFAINHPDRATSLVLLCPQVHRWDDKRWLPRASRWTLPLVRRAVLRKALLALYRIQLRRMSATDLLKVEAGERYPTVAGDQASQTLCETTLAAMRRSTPDAGFEDDFVIFTGDDIVRADDALDVATLVIHDVMDPLAPVDHVDWLTARFPMCERLSIRAAGHLVWTGPDAQLMHASRVRFLKQHAAGRASSNTTRTA